MNCNEENIFYFLHIFPIVWSFLSLQFHSFCFAVHYEADENGYRVTKMLSEVKTDFVTYFKDDKISASEKWSLKSDHSFKRCQNENFGIFQPIGNGPVQNKLGKAIVQMLVSGVETEYAIQAQPLTEEESAEEEISGFEPASALAADVIVDKN